MTCEHIDEIKKEIKKFTEKFRNQESFIYKKLDSMVNVSDIGAKIEIEKSGRIFWSDKHKAVATYKTSDFHYIAVEALEDLCQKIDSSLDKCKCYEVAMDEKNKTKNKNKDLKIALSELSLSKEKNVKYEYEIASLQKQLTQLVERELDSLTEQYEADEEKVEELRKIFEKLSCVQGINKQNEINELENKKKEIKEALKKKIQAKKTRKIIEKCEQLAELNVKIEQSSNKEEEEKFEEEIVHVSPPRQ